MKIPKLGLDSMCVISVMNLFIIRLDLMLKYSPRNYGIESTWSKTTFLFKLINVWAHKEKPSHFVYHGIFKFQIPNSFTSLQHDWIFSGVAALLIFFSFHLLNRSVLFLCGKVPELLPNKKCVKLCMIRAYHGPVTLRHTARSGHDAKRPFGSMSSCTCVLRERRSWV